MSKDVIDLKKWFKELGLEIDGKVDDDVLKKLIPPQRRDMWRTIMKHVLPKEKVDLVKKSLLLHKLEKRQKPLLAKVESEEDLGYALKYEELTIKYNKIQKEINDAKKHNSKINAELNEKNELKKNLIRNIELKQNTMYLAKHKTDYYNKFIEVLKEKSIICSHFSTESDELLTKSDYQDSLIKCYYEINNAKDSGIMNEELNIGKKLCNAIYTIIRDKSPAILLQTVEDVLMDNINKIKDITTQEPKNLSDQNDNDSISNELLMKKQAELKSKLNTRMAEKENVIKNFEETTILVKNDIINQYKLKYISHIDHELLPFKKNLKDDFLTIIKNNIDCSEISEFQENDQCKNEQYKALDDIIEKINNLNEEIDRQKIFACDALKEFNNLKNDFGLDEVKSIMDELTEDYLKKMNNCHQINKKIISIKNASSCDINNIKKLSTKSSPKMNVINFRTLQDIKEYSETINVIYNLKAKFDEFNNNISTVNNINDIVQKEQTHKTEFDNIVTEIENNILDLNSKINDCNIVTEILSAEDFNNLLVKK